MLIIILFFLFAFLFCLLFYSGYRLNNMASKPKVVTREQGIEEFKKIKLEVPPFENYDFEDMEIVSEYGYNLCGK